MNLRLAASTLTVDIEAVPVAANKFGPTKRDVAGPDDRMNDDEGMMPSCNVGAKLAYRSAAGSWPSPLKNYRRFSGCVASNRIIGL